MDQLKLLVKDVLYKMQDSPDIPYPPIRMSEIASQSSLSAYTSRSESEQSFSNNIDLTPMDAQNNNDTAVLKSITVKEAIFEINQKNSIVSSEVDAISKIPIISDELEKLQIDNRGSHDSIFSMPNRSPLLPKAGKPNKPKIFMGRRALLRAKSDDLQENPSAVVHELVNEKYQDKITHYIGRMYQRRLSRESRNTDDDGTSSNYSAGSLSTIGTPDSLYDGKSYFSLFFPPTPPKSGSEFDFLKSTDDLNKDTTAETFVNSTMNTVGADDVTTDLDYDPQKFLRDALGDVESQSLDESFSNSRLRNSQSMDTVNASSLMSKAGSIYSSVRKSIRRACSFRDRNSNEPSKNRYKGKDRCQSFSPDSFGPSENLMQDLYIQNGIIFQVSKALTYCRNTKDVSSPEYIEAEKILLVASCQKEALQTALDAIEFGEKDKCCQKYAGTLQIASVVYYLKGDVFTEAPEWQNNFTEYFVVIVISGKNVLSSKVLTADKNGEIKANKTFSLAELSTEFEVSIAIYSMKVKPVEKSHRSNLKHHKKDKKTPCPSTKSFFHIHHRSSHRNLSVESVSSIKPSSFTLWGTCTIRCSDIERTHFRMHHVPLSSSLEGYFTAVLGSHVILANKSNGFLTIGIEDKSHLVWNRRWCILDGSLLKYWNYPSEEFSSEPIGSIDLRFATEKVSPADRSICPRPKSLCLLIKKDNTVLKYFLSADSSEEKQSWQEEINFVVGTLGAWRCLNATPNS